MVFAVLGMSVRVDSQINAQLEHSMEKLIRYAKLVLMASIQKNVSTQFLEVTNWNDVNSDIR